VVFIEEKCDECSNSIVVVIGARMYSGRRRWIERV